MKPLQQEHLPIVLFGSKSCCKN